MNHLAVRRVCLACLILVMADGRVGSAQPTRVWTGADLYSDNRIAFPTAGPTLSDTSLIFGPAGPEFGKLITYRVPASKGSDRLISVTMHITRLTEDWDPHILLSDGRRLIGVAVSDAGATEGGISQVVRADAGDRGIRDGQDSRLFTSSLFPAVGESVLVTVAFLVCDASTYVTGTMLGTTGSFFDVPLNRDDQLEFVFMRDNDTGESYQVNSLAIESSVVKNSCSSQ